MFFTLPFHSETSARSDANAEKITAMGILPAVRNQRLAAAAAYYRALQAWLTGDKDRLIPR